MNPNYYGILPASVRYHKQLTPNAKILYTELSALTHSEGYCFAKNSYFAELYEISERSVTRLFSELEKNGFIDIEIIKNSDGTYRKIYLKDVTECLSGTTKMSNGLDKNVYPRTTKMSNGLDKNVYTKEYYKKNNTSNNNNKEYSHFLQNDVFDENQCYLNDKKNEAEHGEKKERKSSAKKKEKVPQLWPAEFSPEMIKGVEDFIQYRKEIKKPFKSQKSIDTKINQLKDQIIKFGERPVIESIYNAIANGYQGTFIDKKILEQKTNNNGYRTKQDEQFAYYYKQLMESELDLDA